MAIQEDPRLIRIESARPNNFSKLPPPSPRWDFLTAERPSTTEYLGHVHDLARDIITSPGYRDSVTNTISNTAWRRFVDGGGLASSFGDRDPSTRQQEIMAIGRMLSYYDISLGLTYGITTALAIMPIQRFGSEAQQEKYLGMIRDGKRIGLAITEAERSGSSATRMDSNYRKNLDGTIDLSWRKKWQGLTGRIEDMPALIITAKNTDSPEDKPTIGFFIVDQEDLNSEVIEMNVLHGISYGINTGDATVNAEDHLMRELTFMRLLTFRDLFTQSRFLFVGMTLGHQEMSDYHAQRHSGIQIGNTRQADMEIPQLHLHNIRARSVILDAIFRRTASYRRNGDSLLNTNTIQFDTEAAIIKVLSSEYAHASAKDRVKLGGATSFIKNGAQQDADNIEPFRTFEGVEDMLYTGIGGDFVFRSRVDNRGFFDREQADRHLEKRTRRMLKITEGVKTITELQKFYMGKIMARKFALGCLDEEIYEPEDNVLAKNLLNDEIQELTRKFLQATRLTNKVPILELG